MNKVDQYQLNGKDSAVVILIDYTDGDGDIGLEDSDTIAPFQFPGPYFYNLYVTPYAVNNGVGKPIMIPSSTDSVNYNDRIKTLTPTGKYKAIYGQIRLDIKALPYPGITPDSMYYTIQVIDRKLHKSNLVRTPALKFVF